MAKKRVVKPQAAPSRRATVPPVNVIKLMDILGGTKTAAQLGVSTTLLYKAKQLNAVTQVIETAAAHALEHLGKPERHAGMPVLDRASVSGGGVYLVTISAEKEDAFQRMVAALGGVAVPA